MKLSLFSIVLFLCVMCSAALAQVSNRPGSGATSNTNAPTTTQTTITNNTSGPGSATGTVQTSFPTTNVDVNSVNPNVSGLNPRDGTINTNVNTSGNLNRNEGTAITDFGSTSIDGNLNRNEGTANTNINADSNLNRSVRSTNLHDPNLNLRTDTFDAKMHPNVNTNVNVNLTTDSLDARMRQGEPLDTTDRAKRQ